MAYLFDADVVGLTGRFAQGAGAGQLPNLSEVLALDSRYYLGSTIRIEEIATLTLSETNPEWIDRDLNYFYPHNYYGSWQLVRQDESGVEAEGEEGFIHYKKTVIKRYQDFTIVAKDGQIYGVNGAGALDNCNFRLDTVEVSVGIFSSGDTTLQNTTDIFTYNHFDRPVKLIDREYRPKILGLGIYLAPGVQAESLTFKYQAVNNIQADLISAPPASCNIFTTNCDFEYSTYLLSNAQLYPNEQAALVALALAGNPPGGEVGLTVPFTCNNGEIRQVWAVFIPLP